MPNAADIVTAAIDWMVESIYAQTGHKPLDLDLVVDPLLFRQVASGLASRMRGTIKRTGDREPYIEIMTVIGAVRLIERAPIDRVRPLPRLEDA
jgi:hypothetical protein